MAKRFVDFLTGDPGPFFAKELAGETPPSFSTLKGLYELASGLYALRPWYLMDESKLILVPDLATGETCHCSVMGALGEIVSVYAYIGTEGYRLFRKMAAGKISGPGEFYASQKSVFV